MTCAFRNPKKRTALPCQGAEANARLHIRSLHLGRLKGTLKRGQTETDLHPPSTTLHSFKIDSNHNLFCFRELHQQKPMISPFSPKKFTFLKVTSFLSWEDETLSLSPQRVGTQTSYFPLNPGCLINRDLYISWFYEIIPHINHINRFRMSFPPFSIRKTTNRLGPNIIAHQTGKPPFSTPQEGARAALAPPWRASAWPKPPRETKFSTAAGWWDGRKLLKLVEGMDLIEQMCSDTSRSFWGMDLL